MAAVVGAGYLAAQEDATRPAGYGHRLALVRERGKVLCADNTELAAWSWIDEDGKNRGFGPDYCRAYAAAVFGDATDDNWEIVNITFAERPTVMQSGEIDVMTIANTWTAHREIHWGNFVDIVHYAGLGMVSSKDSGIMANDWQSLDGMTGCTGAGTNYVQMAADIKAKYGITFELALRDRRRARRPRRRSLRLRARRQRRHRLLRAPVDPLGAALLGRHLYSIIIIT